MSSRKPFASFMIVLFSITMMCSSFVTVKTGKEDRISKDCFDPNSVRRTFTLISQHIDRRFAVWCQSLKFTDVASRYDSDEYDSNQNLLSVGITFWKFVNLWQIVSYPNHNNLSLAYFGGGLEEIYDCSITRNLILDDTLTVAHWYGVDAYRTFLKSISNTKHLGQCLVVVYILSDADLSILREISGCLTGLDILVYHIPTHFLSDGEVRIFKDTGARSLTETLWAWRCDTALWKGYRLENHEYGAC